ncbi:S8 family serine peptidase [Roseateles sp. NT4]|uniref:S8 family serine peptidase n=1 Tax=Roseateles sp. NT4 TaxID=3453715 RepID=UPI003EEA4E8C
MEWEPEPETRREQEAELTLLRRALPGLRQAVQADRTAFETAQALQAQTMFTVCPRTASGIPINEAHATGRPFELRDFRVDRRLAVSCAEMLSQRGCEVLDVGEFCITASAPVRVIDRLFGTELRLDHATSEGAPASLASGLYVSAGRDFAVSGKSFDFRIDHVVFAPVPVYLQALPAPHPPAAPFPHLTLADVADRLHVPQQGSDAQFKGQGIRLAILDSGFFAGHPFFTNRPHKPYSLTLQSFPGSRDPHVDVSGHGTMMASNAFAVAPACDVMGYKQTLAPQAACRAASLAGVDVISMAWGYHLSDAAQLTVVQAEIEAAMRRGVIVVAAVGNKDLRWPAVMPDVIAVGGMYSDPRSGQLSPSTFTKRAVHNGRNLPDVCGLSGNAPAGVYLPLPCPPGCDHDQILGLPAHPDGDGLGTHDGWVYASGSSSAATQVAAVVALILQKGNALGVRHKLDQKKVREILQLSAIPTSIGGKNPSQAPGLPGNTGSVAGLVNVAKALALVNKV